MKVKAQCKFCNKPLELDVDDDYAALRDPFNLLKLASCNRCSDIRVNHRKLIESIRNVCLTLTRSRPDLEEKDRLRRALLVYTRKYMQLIQNWLGLPQCVWEEAMVEPFLSAPNNFSNHLKMLWQTARQTKTLL